MTDAQRELADRLRADLIRSMGGYDAIAERCERLINDPRLLIPGPGAKCFDWKAA